MEIKGIEISQWENGFNFSALRNSEYKFAILRGGYTGYGRNRTKNKDDLFEETDPETFDKITLGYDALDTKGNAKEINNWVQGKNIQSILLVTSFYHMPRSIFEINKINKNLKISPWPVFPKSFNQSVDWIKTRYAWLLFIEYHKFIFVYLKHIF